jgi:hypothetical protein
MPGFKDATAGDSSSPTTLPQPTLSSSQVHILHVCLHPRAWGCRRPPKGCRAWGFRRGRVCPHPRAWGCRYGRVCRGLGRLPLLSHSHRQRCCSPPLVTTPQQTEATRKTTLLLLPLAITPQRPEATRVTTLLLPPSPSTPRFLPCPSPSQEGMKGIRVTMVRAM